MYRAIDLVTYRREPSQQHRAGKPHFLRPKDLIRAFSGESVILGQNDSSVYISEASLCKGHDKVTVLLFASDGDPLKIKNTVESIFLSEGTEPVEPGPHELDLRQFADGIFSGRWYVYEEEGLSFAFLADADYRIRLSKQEALKTFIKILDLLKERC